MPEPIIVEIMTKRDCCLCDTAKETVESVLKDCPARLLLTDIEGDPKLFERYKKKIPVILINGEESFVYKVHPTTLRKKLEELKGLNPWQIKT